MWTTQYFQLRKWTHFLDHSPSSSPYLLPFFFLCLHSQKSISLFLCLHISQPTAFTSSSKFSRVIDSWSFRTTCVAHAINQGCMGSASFLVSGSNYLVPSRLTHTLLTLSSLDYLADYSQICRRHRTSFPIRCSWYTAYSLLLVSQLRIWESCYDHRSIVLIAKQESWKTDWLSKAEWKCNWHHKVFCHWKVRARYNPLDDLEPLLLFSEKRVSTWVARGVFHSCRSVWFKFIPLRLLYLAHHCPLLITQYQYTMFKIPDVVDISTSEYGMRRKGLLRVVKQLRAMGYGQFICVIGSVAEVKLAGKSVFLRRIQGVPLC